MIKWLIDKLNGPTRTVMALCGEDIDSKCKSKPVLIWGEYLLCNDCYEKFRSHFIVWLDGIK